MNTVTSYNLDFLNNYFTSNEFAFINNLNLENQKLDEIVSKETKTRDIIVNFINNLHNSISDIHNDETHSDFLALLSEVQEIFERINKNISIIQDLKQDSSHILNEIMELLIQIEENLDNKELYDTPIQNLKNEINAFSTKNEDVKSKILLNDIKIDTFFQKNIAFHHVHIQLSAKIKKQIVKSSAKDFVCPVPVFSIKERAIFRRFVTNVFHDPNGRFLQNRQQRL